MNLTLGLNTKAVREAYGHFPSGVAAIAALRNGQPQVIVASSFSVGASLNPPLVAFFVQKHSSTWADLVQAPRLGVSILGVGHAGICRQLASYDKAARFEGIQTHATGEGALRLQGAAVWFDCSVFDVHPAGDHDAIQLLIHDLLLEKENAPLVFHQSRFTQLAAHPLCA